MADKQFVWLSRSHSGGGSARRGEVVVVVVVVVRVHKPVLQVHIVTSTWAKAGQAGRDGHQALALALLEHAPAVLCHTMYEALKLQP